MGRTTPNRTIASACRAPTGADRCLFGGATGMRAASHRVLTTKLYNHAQPLIRLEVTDEVSLVDGHTSVGRACA
jgi:hypothetical protein